MEALHKIKGRIIWFNRYEYFDNLICEFPCSEKKLREVITGIMRPGHELSVEFTRNDIYDSRAWAYLPLDCFVDVQGINKRISRKRGWQHDTLDRNEMPVAHFGIDLPWVVSRDCFKLAHRLKDGGRFAEMTFAHPYLDPRFNNLRWVADGQFQREATRAEMESDLFSKVEERCKKYKVTIKK